MVFVFCQTLHNTHTGGRNCVIFCCHKCRIGKDYEEDAVATKSLDTT